MLTLIFAFGLTVLPVTSGKAAAPALRVAGARHDDAAVGVPATLGPALARALTSGREESLPVWVYFTDRAGRERDPQVFEAARRALTRRALDRRLRRGALVAMTDSDLPVHEPYVRALIERGFHVRGASRWLNAASIDASPRRAAELAALPFVRQVELVPRGRGVDPVETAAPEGVGSNHGGRAAPPLPDLDRAQLTLAAPGDTAYYGPGFRQLGMMQVPAMHGLGLSGAGVLVCMLDSGFHLTHGSLTGLDVVAARDFIHGDTIVDNEPGQDSPGQATHGTWTLACVAGSQPGRFSGGAFGAAVALGKTEDTATEKPIEMDNWQFGVEWADSLGADVISSSLGYYLFDDTTYSYTYQDMDGQTTIVTRAAVDAARRGITVVTAAGNEGATSWHYIIAPGDADSVITAGAVDSFNVVTSFSSRGPTSDGRIKPDVTAMGRAVVVPSVANDSDYVRVNGTSFSTPLTAGLVALLLEEHPTWGPFEVREALRETALNHAAPNNDIGWGLVQGMAARSWVPTTTGIPDRPQASRLELSATPNPLRARGGTMLRFAAPGAAEATLDVVDVTGRLRARLYHGPAATQALRWAGSGGDGRALPAGVYWLRLGARRGASTDVRAMRVVVMP